MAGQGEGINQSRQNANRYSDTHENLQDFAIKNLDRIREAITQEADSFDQLNTFVEILVRVLELEQAEWRETVKEIKQTIGRLNEALDEIQKEARRRNSAPARCDDRPAMQRLICWNDSCSTLGYTVHRF